MTDWTVARLDRDTMLALGKALEPLPAATLAMLAEIERLSGLDGHFEQFGDLTIPARLAALYRS